MCSAYNITMNQQAIRSFVSIIHDIIELPSCAASRLASLL
jgi:hypothetical protein